MTKSFRLLKTPSYKYETYDVRLSVQLLRTIEAMVCKNIVALFLAFSLSRVLMGKEIQQDRRIQNQLGTEETNRKLGLNSGITKFSDEISKYQGKFAAQQ